MDIWVLSDIHIDTTRGWDLPPPSERPPYHVLVCAGDLLPGMARGVRWLAERVTDRPVIMIAGNHEFYGRDLDVEINKARQAAAGTNVTVLQNSTAIIGDVLFIGATFWTDFDLFRTPEISMVAAADGLNDYRKIRTEQYSLRLRPHHTLARHLESRAFVEATLRRPKTTTRRILVTHHPLHPVFDVCRPASLKPNDSLAPAYMSDASSLFELGLDAAISGHVHASFDTTVGPTRVVANPKGYGPWQTGGRWENPDFNPHFRLTI